MDSHEFINKLSALGMPVFSVEAASTILGKPRGYTALYLLRLLKAKKIERVERGKYCLQGTKLDTIASRLIPNSYISLYSALEHYALTTQIPKEIEVIAARYHKGITINGRKIRFYKVKKGFVYGYVSFANGPVIAEPEKVFIDDLYLHGRLYLSEELEHAIKRGKLNIDKLCAYAIRSGKKSIASLLGYYLERLGVNADALLPYRSTTYIKLAKKGVLDRKWHVYGD